MRIKFFRFFFFIRLIVLFLKQIRQSRDYNEFVALADFALLVLFLVSVCKVGVG